MKFYILLFTGVFLTACAKPMTRPPEISSAEVGQEAALHEKIIQASYAKGGEKKGWKRAPGMRKRFEAVASRVEDAAASLCREMKIPQQGRGCYYYFELSDRKDINASADGDTVTVNAGMMRFVESDDELALVIAHEVAHNMMDHLTGMRSNAMVGLAIGAALDAWAASEGYGYGSLTAAGAGTGAVAYAPSFEREADYVGLYILARAGYDPHKAMNYWRRLSAQEPDTAYVSTTHPSNPERFAGMKKTVEEISQKKAQGLPLLPAFKQE